MAYTCDLCRSSNDVKSTNIEISFGGNPLVREQLDLCVNCRSRIEAKIKDTFNRRSLRELI